MAVAIKIWRVEKLKDLVAEKAAVVELHHLPRDEMVWFEQMRVEGLVNAVPRYDHLGIPTAFSRISITHSGLKYIEDYESETTWRGIWKRYHRPFLGWVAFAAWTFFVAWASRHYSN